MNPSGRRLAGSASASARAQRGVEHEVALLDLPRAKARAKRLHEGGAFLVAEPHEGAGGGAADELRGVHGPREGTIVDRCFGGVRLNVILRPPSHTPVVNALRSSIVPTFVVLLFFAPVVSAASAHAGFTYVGCTYVPPGNTIAACGVKGTGGHGGIGLVEGTVEISAGGASGGWCQGVNWCDSTTGSSALPAGTCAVVTAKTAGLALRAGPNSIPPAELSQIGDMVEAPLDFVRGVAHGDEVVGAAVDHKTVCV